MVPKTRVVEVAFSENGDLEMFRWGNRGVAEDLNRVARRTLRLVWEQLSDARLYHRCLLRMKVKDYN